MDQQNNRMDQQDSRMNQQEERRNHRALRNPFMDHNFVTLTETDENRAVCTLEIRPESRNPYGYAHGGAIYTIADDVAGYAAHADGGYYVTQSSSMYFTGNQAAGVLTGTADVRHRGRRTCVIDVRVTGENGKLIATGTFDYFRVDGELKPV